MSARERELFHLLAFLFNKGTKVSVQSDRQTCLNLSDFISKTDFILFISRVLTPTSGEGKLIFSFTKQFRVPQTIYSMNIRRDGTEIKFLEHNSTWGCWKERNLNSPFPLYTRPRWKRNLNNCDINIMEKAFLNGRIL